jgi:prophage regulatory protein
MEQDSTTRWFTVSQVANRFGVSVATVWRWVRQGNFPSPVKISERSTRWRRSDIEAHEQRLDGAS